MLFIDANKLLDPGYLPLETGYYRLIDDQILVAVLTCMPTCATEMVSWWFGQLDDQQKKQMVCPKPFIESEIGRFYKKGGYGQSRQFVERMTGGMTPKWQVRFHHPIDFLTAYDSGVHSDKKIICANVYSVERVLESRVIHCVRNTNYGCEIRSRIWLIGASDELANSTMANCIEEMGNLAALLSDLYKHRSQEVFDQ